MTDITIFNPSCAIYDAESTLPADAVIISFENSTAQQYALTYSRQFRAHTHTFTESDYTPPTCTQSGELISICVCGETSISVIPELGHNDSDGDGVCDRCGEVICSCICHQTGFKRVIYKLIRIFCKIFGINKICECGISHY